MKIFSKPQEFSFIPVGNAKMQTGTATFSYKTKHTQHTIHRSCSLLSTQHSWTFLETFCKTSIPKKFPLTFLTSILHLSSVFVLRKCFCYHPHTSHYLGIYFRGIKIRQVIKKEKVCTESNSFFLIFETQAIICGWTQLSSTECISYLQIQIQRNKEGYIFFKERQTLYLIFVKNIKANIIVCQFLFCCLSLPLFILFAIYLPHPD